MKKYRLSENKKQVGGRTLHQVQAVRSFHDVKQGDVGGYIEKESNLSHDGNAWVYENAQVRGNALLYENAQVMGNASVYGDARISGNALVYGNARVCGNASLYDKAHLCGDAYASGNIHLFGNACASGNARIHGEALVYGDARIYGEAYVSGGVNVTGDADIESPQDIVWFSSVGSENGTLTAYVTQDADIEVTRGCFRGTLAEFESVVHTTHDRNQYAKEYTLLIEFIQLRFRNRGMMYATIE